MQDVYTVREAAEYLKIGRITLYKLVREGRIPHRKVGGQIRFSKNQLQQWIEGTTPQVTE